MGKVSPEERAELDEVARWRWSGKGWHLCDPALDDAVDALPLEVKSRIRRGGSVTFAQAQALSAKPPENPCQDESKGQ